MKDDYFKIGFVLKPHGLKGSVTVSLDADIPVDFSETETVFLLESGSFVPYFIEEVSLKGDKAFVKFEDVSTPEGAQSVSKKEMYLPKTARPKSSRGEFYDDEITGFVVEDAERGVLGTIKEVMQAGVNKLLMLVHEGKEVLIPVNGPFIKGINKTKKKISVQLPEGFLDI